MTKWRVLRCRLLVVLLLCLLCPVASHARPKEQQVKGVSIGGIVMTDAPSDTGPNKYGYNAVEGVHCTVSGANVSAADLEKDKKEKDPDKKKYECITDEKGFFHFNALPKGDYTVTFEKAGYPTQTKSAHVTGEVIGDNLHITMNTKDYTSFDGTPTGPGTVYVAFAERQANVASNGENGDGLKLGNSNTLMQALAAGADPMSISGNAPVQGNSKDMEVNGITTEPNSLMIYPPQAPGKTNYTKLKIHPYWVCFNKTGSTLYISSAEQLVQVLDAKNGNRLLQNLPTQGPVTDLSSSLDGRYILVSIIGNHSIMLIDSTTNFPTNLLPCAGPPRAAAMSGDRVFVVEGDTATGHIQILNAVSGASLGMVQVGANPTGIAISPDGRKIFVANSGAASISVLDALTMKEITRIGVGVTR